MLRQSMKLSFEKLKARDLNLQTLSLNYQMDTFVITGGASGIGKATAIFLAEDKDRRIVITSRKQENLDAAIAEIIAKTQNNNVEGILLELTDFKSVDAVADQIAINIEDGKWALKALINNAGLQGNQYVATSAGIEKTFHANHLGTFQLTERLASTLNAQKTRIINVSSSTHDPEQKIPMKVPDYTHPKELAYF